MKSINVIILIWLLLILIIAQMALLAGCASIASASYATGVWDNFDYSKPIDYWVSAASSYGGDSAVIDLAVAQARDGYAALPFPFSGSGTLRSVSDTDLLEPYLSRLDSEGVSAILSIQPMEADITDLIGIILDRYGHHRCLTGINVDLEWKRTGTPQHASNQERDAWTGKMNSYNPHLKLFLTFFKDYTYFPDDDGKMVVMYDGTQDTQENLLKAYGELAKHFAAVGIYTGYATSRPPTASDESILKAAPNTRYIIHTDDLISAGKGAGIEKISLPSAASGLIGFGSGSLSNKMSMPSVLFTNATSSGFPSTEGFQSSIFKKGNADSRDIFKFADQDDLSRGSESLVNFGSPGQKKIAGGSQSMMSLFSNGLTKGPGSYTGSGRRLFS